MMGQDGGLPGVNRIPVSAPLSWLAGAWSDLWKAPASFLTYGFVVAVLSGAISLSLAWTGMAFWALAAAAGFVFIAPMIAMGVYEGGRLIELGRKPTLARIAFVSSAFRRDIALLGLALFIIFAIWIELAQITFGLATNRLYNTFDEFFAFAATTPQGHGMLIWGTVVGGILAWFTFCLVAVSAPMLLDSERDIFTATVTSVRCVTHNTATMFVWAAIIAVMILASIATGFFALVIVIPWLGLASWRAYRTLVQTAPPQNKP